MTTTRNAGSHVDGRRWPRPRHSGLVELGKQVFYIVCGALFYFGVRGMTEGSPATAIRRGRQILAWEERLGIAIEREAQALITDSDTLVTVANWVYIWLHWPIIIVTLLVLHWKRRPDYLILRNAMFVSGAIGLVIFALYPVAPPRLTGQGFVDTVTELSTSYRVLQPPALVNKYAAVPSLHVGWNLLVGIIVFGATQRRWLRALAVAGPLAMGAAVVFTANHYVVDGIAGAIVALAGLVVAKYVLAPLAPARDPRQSTDSEQADQCVYDLDDGRPDAGREHGAIESAFSTRVDGNNVRRAAETPTRSRRIASSQINGTCADAQVETTCAPPP